MSRAILRFFILVMYILFADRLAAQCNLKIDYSVVTDPICYGTRTGSIVADASGGPRPYSFMYTSGTDTLTAGNNNYLPAGTYKLTVTDANNCQDTKTFTLVEPPPITSKVSITNATCERTNGHVVITPSDGVAPYTFKWSDDLPHGSSPTDLAPGNYTVTIHDDHLCQQIVYVEIVNKGGVRAAISNSANVTCFGANDGSATVAVNGSAPYTYLWFPSGGIAPTANNLSAGNYFAVVTDTVGCTDTARAKIIEPAEIMTTITKHDATCGNNNGDASVAVTSPAGSYTYFWTPGNYTTSHVSGLAPATYSVTITNEKGCIKTQAVIIEAGTLPAITEIKHSDVLCNGQQNGTAAPIVTSGVKPYSFNWTSGNDAYTDSSIQGLGIGFYQLTVKDANGCKATASVSISQPEMLAHTVSVSAVTCNSPAGSATVIESGGTMPYSYLWKPNGQTGSTASGLAVGDYVVYVYDKNQCADSAIVKITNTSSLTVTIADNINVSCNGGNNGSATAYATSSSPYTFSWSPGGGTGQTTSGLRAGNYTVSVTDGQGCTATASTQITEPAPVTTQITAMATSCGNNNGSAGVTVSGGTRNYTYNWQPGNYTTANITNIAAGTYTVDVKDANGCIKTDEAIVKPSSIVVIKDIVASDILCNGKQTGSATANVTGGTAPYAYVWANGVTSYTGNPLNEVGSGTYHLTVTDSAGCVAAGSVTVNKPQPLAHTVNTTNATCFNPNGFATVTETGGSAPYTYRWTPTAGNGASATNLSPGDYISYITDSHRCTDTVYISITNAGGVSATITKTLDVSCYGGSNGSATVKASGTASPFSYAWSNIGAATATAQNLTPGNYTVTVTDQQGCTDTATAHISQPAAIQTKVTGNNTTCNNKNGSANIAASGGAAPYSYAWSPGSYTTSAISNLGAARYLVTVKDANGCSTVDSTVIAPSTNPVIDSISRTDVTCYGKHDGTAIATVSQGISPYIYSWTNGISISITPRLQNLVAGDYRLKVTDAAGCAATANTLVKEPAPLQLSISIAHTTCGGDNGSATLTVLGGTNPYRYQWSTGNSNSIISNMPAGTYSVSCTDANGCIALAGVFKIRPSLPLRVSLGNDTIICPGNEVLLNPGNFKSYSWHDNTHNPVYKAVQTGLYAVTVTDSTGCTATATVKVDVNCRDIVFPNAFTPNGDGHNDTFGPLGTLAAIKDYTLTIFNRWGQQIFSTKDPYLKWSGKFNSQDSGTGTFVWAATYSFDGQPKRLQKGTVLVIK